MQIPTDLAAKIDEAITHYPVSKRSATLPLLHLIQENFGFVSDEAIDWIAAKLELQPINVLELVTFYPDVPPPSRRPKSTSASAAPFPAPWPAATN